MALIAATNNDNHFNISKLVIKGADSLDECIEHARRNSKHHACAMLLMIKAAKIGNKAIVHKLFGEPVERSESLTDLETCNVDVQKTVLSGKVSTIVPIEIARRNGHHEVREELLLKTDVNQEERYVYWHGLRLLKVEPHWFRRVSWVQRLRLARNGLKSLPEDMGDYLKQVCIVWSVTLWGETTTFFSWATCNCVMIHPKYCGYF